MQNDSLTYLSLSILSGILMYPVNSDASQLQLAEEQLRDLEDFHNMPWLEITYDLFFNFLQFSSTSPANLRQLSYNFILGGRKHWAIAQRNASEECSRWCHWNCLCLVKFYTRPTSAGPSTTISIKNTHSLAVRANRKTSAAILKLNNRRNPSPKSIPAPYCSTLPGPAIFALLIQERKWKVEDSGHILVSRRS